VNWGNNKLYVGFEGVLDESQEYYVTIDKNLSDKFGNKIKENYIINFYTKRSEFACIVRNRDSEDKIIFYDVTLKNKKILNKAANIKFFDINKNYLIDATKPSEDSFEIHIINRNKSNKNFLESIFNKQSFEIENIIKVNENDILSLDISPILPEFTFVSQ